MIKIKAINKHVPMTDARQGMVEALKFYATKLRIHKMDAEIRLSFKFGFSELFKAWAQVEYSETGVCIIEIDADIPEVIALQICAHEMVHVKQYLKGQLSETPDGLQLWKGKTVEDSLKYTDQPWEVEAMQKAERMKYQYIEFRDGPII